MVGSVRLARLQRRHGGVPRGQLRGQGDCRDVGQQRVGHPPVA